MSGCWASILSDCREHISREHLISASLFPKSDSVFVQGFDWCQSEAREIGIASLTSKILCKHHNSQLSPTDTAAGHAFNNFEFISNILKEAVENNRRIKIKESHINAVLLERWLLKTLINVCYQKEFLIGNGSIAGVPSEELVKICFGKSKFKGESGMYVAANNSDQIVFYPYIKITPIIEKSENRVSGAMFQFAGLKLFLWLHPEKLPNNFDWVSQKSTQWANIQPSKPFRKIKFRIPNGDFHLLHFNW